MSRVFIEADSLTTPELRAALAALNRVNHSASQTPVDLSLATGGGRAFVGLDGPECWSLKTIALYPNQAIGITEAIARASWAPEENHIVIRQDDGAWGVLVDQAAHYWPFDTEDEARSFAETIDP